MNFYKGPDDILDYEVDYTDELGSRGDSVISSTWEVPADLTQPTPVVQGLLKETIWVGAGIQGKEYPIVNRVVSAQGRTLEKTFYLHIV